MKIVQIVTMVLCSLLVIFIAGCKKDSVTNPLTGTAQERVDQGNQVMYPHLFAVVQTGGKDTAALNMTAAYLLFEEALAADPGNNQAHLGVAITEVLTSFSDPDVQALFQQLPTGGTSLAAMPSKTFSLFNKKSSVSKFGGTLSQSIENRLSGIVNPDFPFGISKSLKISDLPHQPSYYQDLIATKFLPVISDAITHLKTVTQDQSFYFYITPAEVSGQLSDSVRIDLREVYLILAAFQFIDAEASFLVSYNVDYTSTNQALVLAAWQVNSPFVALRTNGSQHMKDVLTNYIGVTNSIQSDITFLRTQTTAQPGIIPIVYNPADEPTLTQVYAGMDSIQNFLSGPYTIAVNTKNNGTINLTVNFKNFFNSAIANYKAEFPPYTASTTPGSGSNYLPVLTWTQTSFAAWAFPDPTFSGFLPGMTTTQIEAMAGITVANWKSSITIGN